MRIACPLIALSFLCAAAAAQAGVADHPVVRIASGRIAGATDAGVSAFLGVPYAASPAGENRWRAPQPVSPWSGVRQSDRFGPSCPQAMIPSLGPWTHEYMPQGEVSEDCLTLNVWKPSRVTGKRRLLPVMVWIHGGGFTSGSSSVAVYDGAKLAAKGVVVVSINYRVGYLGSLASPEFRSAGGGNFGIQDQISALNWVRRNIGAFGGDPRQVTVAGQSAGAFSVHYLMLAPAAQGLFRRAIAQSGTGLGAGFDLWLDQRDQAERNAERFLEASGVTSVAQARMLPLARLSAGYAKAGGIPGSPGGFRIKPYADGATLPLDPAAALRAGRYNDVPVLIGLTADENSGLYPNYRTKDADLYPTLLKSKFGDKADDVARLYPMTGEDSPMPQVLRDAGIAATMAWSIEHKRKSDKEIYGYVWSYVEPGPESTRYAAFHTSEVPYVFGTLNKAPERNFSSADWRMSDLIQTYWINFVKTGNPNGTKYYGRKMPFWPEFGAGHQLMELGGRIGPYRALDPKVEAVLVGQIQAGTSFIGM